MKKILRITGIGIALVLALTGCNEAPESVTNTNGTFVDAEDKAEWSANPEAADFRSDRYDERADQGTISIAESSAANTEPSERTAEAAEYEEYVFDNDELPYETDSSSVTKDYISDTVYEREDAMIAIVAGSKTVEELEENITEYNADNQNGEAYSVTEVAVFDDGKAITSGLLKDGMYVRADFGSGGYTEYRVTRAPKDCIPDDAELPGKNAVNDDPEAITIN